MVESGMIKFVRASDSLRGLGAGEGEKRGRGHKHRASSSNSNISKEQFEAKRNNRDLFLDGECLTIAYDK